jgi:aldehyde:ferredoxin oxidoreductase
MMKLSRGYMGKTLKIDLSQNRIEEISFPISTLRDFIGGRGLAAKIIFEEIPKGINPLDPENVVVFMTGPYTGTMGAPCSARYEVASLSAHTGFFGGANSGGFFGPALKRSGFDGVIIKGRASDPVYLWIDNGKAEIRSAAKLWGKDSFETEDLIRKEHDDKKIKVVCIGPSGENLITHAAVMNDKGRAAARGGTAAVLGSKNFKAIACRGNQKVEVAFPKKFGEVVKKIVEKVKKDAIYQLYSLYGTPVMLLLQEMMGDTPVKNWTRTSMKGMEKLSGHYMYKTILTKNAACSGCVVSCNREIRIDKGKYKLEENPAAGPEYETIGTFGTMCMVDDLLAVSKANDICNRVGLDTITAGSIVAYAMECYEKGFITKEDLGFELKWGDADAMLKCLDLIVKREKIGAILAQGVKKASKEIEGSDKLIAHAKGLEMPMHDPRYSQILGLHYATAPCGARHTSGYECITVSMAPVRVPELDFGSGTDSAVLDKNSTIGKARALKTIQERAMMTDSMGMCNLMFVSPTFPMRYSSAALALVTGFKMKYRENFLKTGERIFNLIRCFNLKHGATPKDDTLSHRLLKQPLKEGATRGIVVNLKPMLEEYYELRRWDKQTGIPTKEKLEELGLDFIIKEFY